jgi:hypothetical protein
MKMKIDDGVMIGQFREVGPLELNTMGVIHGCAIFPIGGGPLIF